MIGGRAVATPKVLPPLPGPRTMAALLPPPVMTGAAVRAAEVEKKGPTPRGVAAKVASKPKVPPLQLVVAVGAPTTMAAFLPSLVMAMLTVLAAAVVKDGATPQGVAANVLATPNVPQPLPTQRTMEAILAPPGMAMASARAGAVAKKEWTTSAPPLRPVTADAKSHENVGPQTPPVKVVAAPRVAVAQEAGTPTVPPLQPAPRTGSAPLPPPVMAEASAWSAVVAKAGATPRGVATKVAATPKLPPLRPVVAVGAPRTIKASLPPPVMAVASARAVALAKGGATSRAVAAKVAAKPMVPLLQPVVAVGVPTTMAALLFSIVMALSAAIAAAVTKQRSPLTAAPLRRMRVLTTTRREKPVPVVRIETLPPGGLPGLLRSRSSVIKKFDTIVLRVDRNILLAITPFPTLKRVPVRVQNTSSMSNCRA